MRTNYILKNAPVVWRVSRKCNVREESYTQKEQTNSDWKEENRKKKKKKKSTETKTRSFRDWRRQAPTRRKSADFGLLSVKILELSPRGMRKAHRCHHLSSSLGFLSLYAPFLQPFHTFLPGANSFVVFTRRFLSLQTTLKSLFFCICIEGLSVSVLPRNAYSRLVFMLKWDKFSFIFSRANLDAWGPKEAWMKIKKICNIKLIKWS